ncbi:hypothetical protein AAVH_17312 [Aphelenchoides avenae]|nr:hypothetical protein AAVH_17312 [Aphelenchus avenae]
MRTLDKWLKCTPYSAPAVMQAASSGNSPASKRSLGLRAPADYRTEQLIEEIRKNRVLWNRDARGFYSPTARGSAYKRVAVAMNRRFPEVRPWHFEEVQHHWRLLVQYQYACMLEHGPEDKPHSFTCRQEHMSWMNSVLISWGTDWRTFIAHL